MEARRLHYMLDEFVAEQIQLPGRSLDPTVGSGPTRIALLATPRSGTTWLRLILGHVLDLEELSVFHPADLDWAHLPERVVIHLHWPRTAHLQSLLEAARVNVVTMSRHPFDVLVSILRMAQTEPKTIGWLWGRGGDEEALLDADPSSEDFAQWALSERALNLLDVTRSWLVDDQVARVSYERLVVSPEEEVGRLLEGWSLLPSRPISEAVTKFTPNWVNEQGGVRHSWTATSNLWTEVIPSALADRLRVRYHHHLDQLGFAMASDSKVDHRTAKDRWGELYPDPDPLLPEDAYRAEVVVLDPPSTVPARSSFVALVKVHNRGTVRWPDRLRHPLIRLGCRWYSSDGSGTTVLEDRYILGSSLMPGGAAYEHAQFATPAEPGVYQLQVDLVHEHNRWFGCGEPIEVTVS